MLSVNDKLSDTDAVGIGRKGTIDKPLYLKAPFWTVDTLFYCTSKENSDVKFIYLLFQIINWKRYDESTGVPSLSKNTISSIKTYVPKVKEQDHISKLFFSLDNTLQLHERKCEELTLIKKALLQKLFPKKDEFEPEVRYKNFSDAWEQRRLGEVADVRDGTHDSPKYINEGYPLLTSKNVGDGYINYDDVKYVSENDYVQINKRSKVDVNDILMGMIGTIGNLALIREEPDFAIKNVALIKHTSNFDYQFLFQELQTSAISKELLSGMDGGTQKFVSLKKIRNLSVMLPSENEQKKIGSYLMRFDSLIALHQRKPFIKNGGIKMITSNFTCDSLFKDYFEFWIKLYKEDAVRPVTLEKYRNNQKHIAKIIPNLKMKDFDRNAYQELLNQYALTHERQTVIDFHHQVKGAILDAVDDGLIDRDPTRKAIFKGKAPREKKQKYLNQFELHNLLEDLDLGMEITWDWLILLIAKTGLRFSEALGLTPADFDFARQTISVNKTWDYKTNTGFQPTKNRSSIRKVQMDWQLGMQFQHLIKNLNEDEPIFVNGPVCNSTPNNCLARHCRKCGIPEISIHGLRHTHASLLMFAGVSIASVSRRLGHSSITTTQKVYMHIISELENQDNDLVMRYLSSLS